MANLTPITMAEAQSSLKQWLDALSAASSGQSYSIAGRSLTRQDIPEIRNEIQRWHNTVQALSADANGKMRPLGAQASFPAPGRGSGGLISQALWEDYRT